MLKLFKILRRLHEVQTELSRIKLDIIGYYITNSDKMSDAARVNYRATFQNVLEISESEIEND